MRKGKKFSGSKSGIQIPGKEKPKRPDIEIKDLEMRAAMMYKMFCALELTHLQLIELTDLKRPGGPLVSYGEYTVLSKMKNTLQDFNRQVWRKATKETKDKNESLIYENVAGGLFIFDIAVQIPPQKMEKFIEKMQSIATELTAEALAEMEKEHE